MNYRAKFVEEIKQRECFGKKRENDRICREGCMVRKYCTPPNVPFGAKVIRPTNHRKAMQCQFCGEILTSKRNLALHKCGTTRFNPKALNDSVDIKALDENY